MNKMEIGTKVYLKPDQTFIVVDTSDYSNKIELKSPNGETHIYTTINDVTTSPATPLNQPTCQPNISTLKKGDLIITKPTAKSASGCQIDNMVGIVESIVFDVRACTIKWIYYINHHRYPDSHYNTIHTSEIAHIHTPIQPQCSTFSSEFCIDDIIATGPNTRSISGMNISNLIGVIHNIYPDGDLNIQWINILSDNNAVHPYEDLCVIYRRT